MSSHPQLWKAKTAAVFATLAVIFLVIGALARFVPSGSLVGPLARMFDSVAPHFLFLTLVCSVLAAIFGMRRVAGALVLGACVSAAFQFVEHQQLSLPLASGATADIRILFMNVTTGNDENAARIVETALSFDPDVIVFAESQSVHPSLDALRKAYPFVTPCEAEDCQLLLAAKSKPKRFWTMTLNTAWDDRYAVAEIETKPGSSFFLAINHLSKPWFSGIAESEHERLVAQYNWLKGPSVVVGDFNASPWSRPMVQLLSSTGMKTLRFPKGTWPTGAGDLGVPIDHVLVRDGARVVGMTYLGGDLGSNHRGFVADITLP